MSRRSMQENLLAMKAILPELCTGYEGVALFPPPPTDFAIALGSSKGMLYHGGTTYGEKLEDVSGLTVVHTGIVLGDPSKLVAPSPITERVEEIAKLAGSLSPEEYARLMARLALEPR